MCGCWSLHVFLKIRSSSRALKRLKKSGTSDGNDSDNGGRDTDRSNTNSERNRREHEEEVGSNRSSSTRRSGEVGYTNAEHGGANNNQSSSGSNRRRDWDSKRSLSRSRSSSPSTLFDRLKVNWGREGWQDFELLRNNVPGPGTKGYAGPGASQGKSECPSVDRFAVSHHSSHVHVVDLQPRICIPFSSEIPTLKAMPSTRYNE